MVKPKVDEIRIVSHRLPFGEDIGEVYDIVGYHEGKEVTSDYYYTPKEIKKMMPKLRKLHPKARIVKPKGWHSQSQRHALARKGIKTGKKTKTFFGYYKEFPAMVTTKGKKIKTARYLTPTKEELKDIRKIKTGKKR